MTATSIEWTDAVWNPTRGCSRVSAGCDHCYAMREARRHDHPGGAYEGFTRVGKRGVDWSGVVRLVPEQLQDPLRWKKPRRVFVNSMSDLFHESLSKEAIERVFAVMVEADQHTFQVLTKRPGRMREWVSWWLEAGSDPSVGYEARMPPNVWLGVSVEDQATADERIPLLLQTPASVRFVSYEPALGPVRFGPGTLGCVGHIAATFGNGLINWVIVGGESGPGARPCDVAWARSTVEHCKAAGVPCFVKQLGARPYQSVSPASVGMGGIGLGLRDRKGGDMLEWPEDLRVREFPQR